MIHDTVNKVTTITIQTSQFIHFQLNSSSRINSKQLSKQFKQDLLSRTGIKVAIFTANYRRVIIRGIFVVEKAELFSKVAGAHVFKTRYGWFDCFHCC